MKVVASAFVRALMLAGVLAGASAQAQPAGPGAAPAPAGPVSPPPADPSPSPPAAPAQPSTTARPTLVPEAGDPGNVDTVILPEKPVLILPGSSTWDEGLKSLRAAFSRIEAELARLGLAPAGRPIAVFTQTTDDDFKFDAMIPVAAAPSAPGELAKDMRFGVTPSGQAFRFVHKGPYDDIDSTYDTITTYLEAKDVVARDIFIEEFLNDVDDTTDPGLEVNIFVQPK